jgi:integrase/recombinase XerC
VDDAVTAHLDHLRQRGLSEGTIDARRRVLHRLERALPVPLLEASEADLAAWRAGLTVNPSTVVAYLAHVRDFYGWCAVTGRTGGNPAQRIPSPKIGRRLPRPIAEEDLMYALDCAPERIRPWLVLAGWAGLRAQEIAFLERENVLDAAVPPLLLISSEAAKGRKERVVPMSAFVLAELRAAGLPLRGYVFPRYDDLPGPNAPWLVSQLAGAHLHACGIEASLHQLRHRFLTAAYRVSHDLREVQELAGHQSPSTTAGYAAYDRESAVVTVEAIPVPPHLRAVSEEGTAS